MERGERWLSLVIFFSFLRINFRGRRDSHESHLPLFGTIYFPTAPFSNLLPHINRAKSDEQSWYPVLNSYRWVHFIKHPLIDDYKGYFPLFRYDGEPSVSTGIVSQLPSFHLFIHWVPAKLSYRVYALWSVLLPATALVCFGLLTDLIGSVQHYFSGRCAVLPL